MNTRARRRLLLRGRRVTAARCSYAHTYYNAAAVVNFVKVAGSGAKAPIQLARYVYMLVDGLKS